MVLLCASSAFPEAGIEKKGHVSTTVSGILRDRLLAVKGSDLAVRGERLYALDRVRDFYGARDFVPAWTGEPGVRQAQALLKAIKGAREEGLEPAYYHRDAIARVLSEMPEGSGLRSLDPDRLADLELLLTDAYLILGCHFSAGCVNPLTSEAEWFISGTDRPVEEILDKALRENSIEDSLRGLLPAQQDYARMRDALRSYRALASAGGWQPVPEGASLRIGDRDPRVAELRRRLVASGDLWDSVSDEELFDEMLRQAVFTFQERHGLTMDGIVGPKTLAELNVPVGDRVRQLEVNLERMRWISGSLSRRYIRVNIAAYELDVIEEGHRVLSMKVIVGKPYWKTPVFSEQMRYLVYNPYWNIPRSIAVREILPKVRRSPAYLGKEDIRVVSGWGRNESLIDPGGIDWPRMTAGSFRHRFRQDPGPLNPLGRIKFMFPNQYNVYLHDTPARSLFERDVRSFSHGCIRVERPIDLAEYVLRSDPRWSREAIVAAIEEGRTREVRLPKPIMVHIVYFTAWVDEQKIVHFRNDIYGRDRTLAEALGTDPSPTSEVQP